MGRVNSISRYSLSAITMQLWGDSILGVINISTQFVLIPSQLLLPAYAAYSQMLLQT